MIDMLSPHIAGLIYKPYSVWYLHTWIAICLCGLPETISFHCSSEQLAILFLLDLAPERGCLANALLQFPVVSYTTISPLPIQAVYFCGPNR